MKVASTPSTAPPLPPVTAELVLGPPLVRTAWDVAELRLSEGLGLPYSMQLEVRADDLQLHAHSLVGVSASLSYRRDGVVRSVHGIVDRAEYRGLDTHHRSCFALTVVPALAMLRHHIDTRIFTHATVPEILQQVLAPLVELGRPAVDVSRLQASYQPRDYCVQYRESDLDFAHRLMAEEGIVYRFEEDENGEAEHLVLCDTIAGYVVAHDPLTVLEQVSTDYTEELVYGLVHDFHHRPSVFEVSSYNWRTPTALDFGAVPDGGSPHVFEHDVHRLVIDTADNTAFIGDPSQSEQRAALLERSTRASATSWHAQSNATTLAPGTNFEVESEDDHFDSLQLVVVEVSHIARFPIADDDSPEISTQHQYENSFRATTVHFVRNYDAPRPTINGPQTAIVVGPEDEEIWVDADGRVQVRFHWERNCPSNTTTGWWVRVSSGWAGAGFGAVLHPRIGMEVVVEFLNGNPDCPLITGAIYNANNRHPYVLPDDKTKSTLRSRSSKNSNGFNELRFEDAAGSEELFLHAQKTMTEVVKGSRSSTIGAKRSTTIGGDDSTTVDKDQTVNVNGSRNKKVLGTETRCIDGVRSTELGADDTCTTVGKTKHVLQGGLDVTVLKNAKHIISDKHEVIVTGEHITVVNGVSSHTITDTHDAKATNRYAVAQAEAAKVVLEAGVTHAWGESQAVLSAGAGESAPATVSCSADGKVIIEAASEISLKCGQTMLTLNADGTLSITGPQKVEVAGGEASTLSLGSMGIEVGSPEIKVNANGVLELIGALIKLN